MSSFQFHCNAHCAMSPSNVIVNITNPIAIAILIPIPRHSILHLNSIKK